MLADAVRGVDRYFNGLLTSTFANATAFHDPKSLLRAMGSDLSAARAIVDARGQALAYARTGGMISPTRFELHSNETTLCDRQLAAANRISVFPIVGLEPTSAIRSRLAPERT